MLKRCGALLRGLTSFRTGFRTVGIAVTLAAAVAGQAAAAPNAALVLDVKSGKVLYESNADAQRFPASLTKVMTLYMLFEAIEQGKTRLDDRITMSKFAAGQPPTKLGIGAGKSLTVREAMLALITRSANDAATAIGEHLAGSEKVFAQRMTARARQLGMTRTTFRNAHGLPNAAQVTTARDMVTLGRAIKDHFPQYFKYFSTQSFVFRGKRIPNHNRLLGSVEGVNGIKTGYTRASGFNIVTSVDRGGRSIVAVVIGGDTAKARDQRMRSLIETYLPKARRGSRTAPIARGGPGTVQAMPDIRVASASFPAPRLRPSLAVAAAEAPPVPVIAPTASVAANAAPMPLLRTRPAEAPALGEPEPYDQIAALMTGSITAGANSYFALDDFEGGAQEGDALLEDDAEEVTAVAAVTAAAIAEPQPEPQPIVMASAQSGWKIQLAATPSQQGAEEILGQAMAKGARVLASASPYTEPVKSGGSTLYRARFAGFSDKEAARNACAYLTKQKFTCLAIAN